ncbi:MAG: GlcNAc-PI de-N-acetylase [Candidatus Binatia bacterium]|nr:MAG: GlcNAc-PI de-N-acetylase [Candidatus Binatia bacterium]
MERILVFGTHPDDAEIGAGGTIASFARRGYPVLIVNFRIPAGNGDASEAERERRRKEGERAAGILGAQLCSFGLRREEIRPDARLVGTLDRLLQEFRPTQVYTHWVGDSHPEHVATTRAVLAATRRNSCSVYMYEATIPGGITERAFRPQRFVDISDTIECKIRSLESYETQLEVYGPGWIAAVRGRAAERGFQVGCAYAEAFEVVKEIVRPEPRA